MVSYEATKIMTSLSTYDDNFNSRTVTLSAIAFTSWAFATSALLAAFKWIFRGDFDLPSTTAGGFRNRTRMTHRTATQQVHL